MPPHQLILSTSLRYSGETKLIRLSVERKKYQYSVADPETRLGGHIMWRDPAIRLRDQFNKKLCFPVSHVYFFVGGGTKVFGKTGWIRHSTIVNVGRSLHSRGHR